MDKVTELREALAKATDCKLEEDGEYFEEGRYCDLTQCHHGETGRYQNRHDGKLIALLWNNRHALIDALATPAPDSEKLREALTPSGDTKAAYLGEFKFDVMFPSLDEDDDEPVPHPVTVPWDTIKEIMAAIANRAALGASL